MNYAIRHTTRFQYSSMVAESVTEVRMQPRSTEVQRCSLFRLHVRPQADLQLYQDHLGNTVHHFSLPAPHREQTIVAESEVHVAPLPALPQAMTAEDWGRIDELIASGEHWDMLMPSENTANTVKLAELAQELNVVRRDDPLSLLREINAAIHRSFAYDARITRVDSPIDEPLSHRRGVCQDFTHIMIALARNHLHIPCRYVSGYLYHRRDDRSADGASHAWLEVLLPDHGWVGFDPTNNIMAGQRHIQVAIGRDYHDVPPTRGVFKGNASSDLSVTVRVRMLHDPDSAEVDDEEGSPPAYRTTETVLQERYAQTLLAIQMQQQQQ
jgi:transglutaminase-like putative cysteine protease